MKVGLYFGSFNPIHTGHLVIGQHMLTHHGLDEVWFVVTPRSPFKQKQSLLDDHHRLRMVEEAVEGYPKLRASNIEFDLPQPNYTINTLVHLGERYPEGYRFSLIMGSDNLKSLHRWKNHEEILAHHEVYIYPRISEGEVPERFADHPGIHHVDAPIIEISATAIRRAIGEGLNVRPMLTEPVWRYLDEMNFYKR